MAASEPRRIGFLARGRKRSSGQGSGTRDLADQVSAGSSYSVAMTDVRATPLRELVEAHREEIKTIVARHHGQSVAIFGSVARGEERPDSDLDFLVELAPNARPIEILSIGVELEEALGVKVDVGTPESLRERLRDEVLAEALPL